MINLKSFLLLIFVFVICSFASSNCLGQKIKSSQTFEKVVNSFIEKQEKSTSGKEFREGREVLNGKLNNSKVVAVLFTIEGIVGQGNSSQFLVVFVNENGKFVYKSQVQVGGKGIRFANFDSIKENVVKLDTEEYLASDALCCPSGKGKTQYAFVGGNLIELSTR